MSGSNQASGPRGEREEILSTGGNEDFAALADARERAERLASLSQAKLGRLIAVSEAGSGGYLAAFAPQRCGVSDLLAPGLFEYQAATATADEVTVTTTLEVTFALER